MATQPPRAWLGLTGQLGYEEYLSQGGDWGYDNARVLVLSIRVAIGARGPHRAIYAGLAVLLFVASACSDHGATTQRRFPRLPASSAPTTRSPPGSGGPCGTGAQPPARYEHVMWIWMENHTRDQVIGSTEAPYETTLAAECGTATNYASVGSPSLPNYIAATSGDTQGIHDDAPPASHPVRVDNLFREVRATGGTEKSYEESMPANCALGSEGMYAVKHNPAAYYVGGNDRQACLSDDVPLGGPSEGALRHDFDTNALPSFSYVTPNLCHDTHDCGVQSGDQWLEQWVPMILASDAYRSGATAVFIVWDEPTPTPFIAVSPTTAAGTMVTTPLDHYALLRTTEEMLGISAFLDHTTTAPDMRPAFGL